ncbi:hypothetical protein HAX54_005034, partial [Datura stramonium]|nr:hypothetical protein [Datura stramonium]
MISHNCLVKKQLISVFGTWLEDTIQFKKTPESSSLNRILTSMAPLALKLSNRRVSDLVEDYENGESYAIAAVAIARHCTLKPETDFDSVL